MPWVPCPYDPDTDCTRYPGGLTVAKAHELLRLHRFGCATTGCLVRRAALETLILEGHYQSTRTVVDVVSGHDDEAR